MVTSGSAGWSWEANKGKRLNKRYFDRDRCLGGKIEDGGGYWRGRLRTYEEAMEKQLLSLAGEESSGGGELTR